MKVMMINIVLKLTVYVTNRLDLCGDIIQSELSSPEFLAQDGCLGGVRIL